MIFGPIYRILHTVSDCCSFILWDANTGSQVEPPNTPYGPYPCKSIVKFYGNGKTQDNWRIFAGGMPRASYGEKFTVTVMKNEEEHTVLDIASKIVDFLVIETSEGAPDSLLILRYHLPFPEERKKILMKNC